MGARTLTRPGFIWGHRFAYDPIDLIKDFSLVKRKLERRDALAVSANIINELPLSFLHYHMGALHPYFPDLPNGFDYNSLVRQLLKPPKEEFK